MCIRDSSGGWFGTLSIPLSCWIIWSSWTHKMVQLPSQVLQLPCLGCKICGKVLCRLPLNYVIYNFLFYWFQAIPCPIWFMPVGLRCRVTNPQNHLAKSELQLSRKTPQGLEETNWERPTAAEKRKSIEWWTVVDLGFRWMPVEVASPQPGL